MNKVIEAIKEYQEQNRISDGGLIKLLQIDRSTWSLLKRGKRNPGVKFLKAVAREIPQLRSIIAVEIFNNNITHNIPETSQITNIAPFRWLPIANIVRAIKRRFTNKTQPIT